MSTPSWVVDDWYNEYWGHKYGESDFSTCTGHFTQVGRYSSWIAERQLLITANIRILQSKILCIFSACVERDEKGGLCYGWKVPLQRKKGQIQKGQVGIHIFFCLLIIDGCLWQGEWLLLVTTVLLGTYLESSIRTFLLQKVSLHREWI